MSEAILTECGLVPTPQGWRIPPAFANTVAYLPTDSRKAARYFAGILRGRLVSATGTEKAELRRLLGKVESGNAA